MLCLKVQEKKQKFNIEKTAMTVQVLKKLKRNWFRIFIQTLHIPK